MVMASDQVFIPATNQNPTAVSGLMYSYIRRMFNIYTNYKENIYYVKVTYQPAVLVIDLGEIGPVNTLEISTF